MPVYHPNRVMHAALVARLKNGGQPLTHRQAVTLADEIQDAIAQALRQGAAQVEICQPERPDRRDSFGMRIE